jgi:integrase
MRDKTIGQTVRQRTRDALGFQVGPHRFRLAAATFWSMQDPANVRGAKDLLGHATFATTEKHYIMAQSRVAGHALARAIEGKRRGALCGTRAVAAFDRPCLAETLAERRNILRD